MRTNTDILIAGLSNAKTNLRNERDTLRTLAQAQGDRAATFRIMVVQAWTRIYELERRDRRLTDRYLRVLTENRALRARQQRAA